MKKYLLISLGFILPLILAIIIKNFVIPPPQAEPEIKSITVTSSNFTDGGKLPIKYSCDGINVSPHISWTPGPEGTRFYVLLMEESNPPATPFAHWIVYNIPQKFTELHEGISTNGILQSGAIQGRNDKGKLGYFGPCPMDSEIHYYVFKVYAVDIYLQMASAYRQNVVDAIRDHILAKGQLTCTFKR